MVKKINSFLLDNKSKIWIQVLILFLIAIVTRLPFQSKILHEWDSVNFALALDKFDLSLHQPHPPGLFFFLIVLGRIFNYFLQDANASLVWISTLATGLASGAIFILSNMWFGRKTALIIAFLMLTSPLVWFQGELALSYMLEFFWVLLIVISCYQLRLGNKYAFFAAALLLGLAGGIRPNTSFFLFPLWCFAVVLGWRENKYKLSDFILAILLGLLGISCWLIPMIISSGGINKFFELMQPWLNTHPYDGVGRGVHGVYLNFKILLEAILYGMGFSIIPTIWLIKRDFSLIVKQIKNNWIAQTIILWLIPSLSYLTFIHIQRLGHSFTIMPVLIILGGLAISKAIAYLAPLKPQVKIILPTLIFLGNTIFFLLAPGKLDNLPTFNTIRDYDSYITERIQAIAVNFSPRETIIITRGRNARIREFYLPDYEGSSFKFSLGSKAIELPDRIKNLVLFDDNALEEINHEIDFKELALPTQGNIRYFTWGIEQQAKLSKSSLELTISR